MESREKQWLLWVGKLYQDVIDSDQPADSIISARMRVEGRRWGHDARRWVSAVVYSMVRSRIRTLWFWASGVTDFDPLRRIVFSPKFNRPVPAGRGATRSASPSPASSSSDSTPDSSSFSTATPFVGPGTLNIADAVAGKILPDRFAAVSGELRALAVPPVAEAVVAWISRRRDSPLHQLARAFGLWLTPAETRDLLAVLSEGAGRPFLPSLADALLGWADRAAVWEPVGDDPAEQLSWNYSIPVWLAERWCGILGGEEALRLAEVFEQPAPIYLRVNSLKTTEQEVLDSLREENYLVDRADEVPGALVVVHRANLYRSQAFNEGLYEVQDLSSQVVALALDPRPGERVLDYCAGAGGKTLHLAALLQNKGLLWALDVDPRRLVRLRIRAARADAYNIRRGLLEPFTPEELQDAWERAPRVPIEDTDYPYSATLSPRQAPDCQVPVTPARLPPEGRSGTLSDVPEPMRTVLGLDVPDPREAAAKTAEAAAAAATRGPKPKPVKYKDRKAAELPEPSEEEKQKLREALESIPRDFDAVLVDAPCSGTGTCRRRPDFGWRVTPQIVQDQLRDQAAILRAGARYVRPGGRLLYATCSLLPEENEDQVLSFLADHPDFAPENLAEPFARHGLSHWLPPGGSFWLTLLPSRRPGDGFFIALLRRKADTNGTQSATDRESNAV